MQRAKLCAIPAGKGHLLSIRRNDRIDHTVRQSPQVAAIDIDDEQATTTPVH
jgi:hypothetical protein